MKTELLKQITLLAILICAFFSCKKEEPIIDNPIVGKWEIISEGYSNTGEMWKVDSNGAYTEYFSDGTMGYYYTGGFQMNGNYQIQSNLLIYNYDKPYEIGGRYDYKYEFSDNYNQLKLTFVKGNFGETFAAVPDIVIYQRIK